MNKPSTAQTDRDQVGLLQERAISPCPGQTDLSNLFTWTWRKSSAINIATCSSRGQVLVPSTHTTGRNHPWLQSQGIRLQFWCPWAVHVCGTHRHTHGQNICTNKIKILTWSSTSASTFYLSQFLLKVLFRATWCKSQGYLAGHCLLSIASLGTSLQAYFTVSFRMSFPPKVGCG